MSTFFAAMWPTFFMRVRPASRNANPACMNITRIAAMITQTVLVAMASCLDRHPTSTSSSDCPVRLCVTLSTGVVQDDPVARLVPAAGSVDDRRHDLLGHVVADDEGEHRLRQEPRLEDPPAVLVRDPALPAVADRLDDGHADVSGLRPPRRRSPSRRAP